MEGLAIVRDPGNAASYPTDLLERCDTALILFAAGFHGAQDAVWIADAGLGATCVDHDAAKLGEMVLAYPVGWEYVPKDVWLYAGMTNRTWDLVSIDCPSGAFDVCAEQLDRWCALANRAVVLGCGQNTDVNPPEGWKITDVRKRSEFAGGVYWAVIEREA